MSRASDRATARRRIAELQRRYPLPAHWSFGDRFLETTSIADVRLYAVGLEAHGPARAGALGAAAESGAYPVERAFFELLERVSIVDAKGRSAFAARAEGGELRGRMATASVFPPDKRPERFRSALSNGVALHDTWTAACEAARLELIERDRVLRSFRGECRALRIDARAALSRALRPHYEVQVYEFAAGTRAPVHRVAGAFFFPRTGAAPLVYGFGAAGELNAALAKAEREALQRLAFLWGEALPKAPPAPAPAPDYHQDYYLYASHHGVLVEWLKNRRVSRREERAAAVFDGSPVTFVDLTPRALRGRVAVAKATSNRARQLRFGVEPGRKNAPPHPMV
jgi:hypothetical protein